MHLFTLCGTHGVGNVSAKIFWRKTHESTTSIPRTDVLKGLHRCRSSDDWRQVHQPCYARQMELLSSRVGNAGGDVIETVITIFAIGFLGIALAIGGVCIMVWMALNED